jgi:hypothetical protein
MLQTIEISGLKFLSPNLFNDGSVIELTVTCFDGFAHEV